MPSRNHERFFGNLLIISRECCQVMFQDLWSSWVRNITSRGVNNHWVLTYYSNCYLDSFAIPPATDKKTLYSWRDVNLCLLSTLCLQTCSTACTLIVFICLFLSCMQCVYTFDVFMSSSKLYATRVHF